MCVWAAAEHYNQRNRQHIHEWRRKRATPDIHIHTERAASKLHNWMTTWKRICTENIHVWEIHLNDWHLSTEISQKNIHDGTTQSTTEIGKYNHRQFTHRCSTSRSSQAGRWSQEARPQTKSRRQPGLGTLSSASSLPSHAPQDFARLQLSMSWSASGADYVLSP